MPGMKLVPRWQMPLWTRIAWTVLLALLAALVGVAQTLDRVLKPETWSWVHKPGLQVTLVVALAAATLVDTSKRTWVRLRMGSLVKQRTQLRNHLASLVATIAEVTQLPISDFGCGLFLVQERGIMRPRRLVRVERVRIIDDLHESDVQFTCGKATVGACWEDEKPKHFDWSRINLRYADGEISDKRWGEMPDNTKRGLSHSEFKKLLGKYAEVLAVPVTIEGKFVGCIAVDRKWDLEDPPQGTVLDKNLVKTPVGGIARTLVPLLKR
jgi:hypothetical protein